MIALPNWGFFILQSFSFFNCNLSKESIGLCNLVLSIEFKVLKYCTYRVSSEYDCHSSDLTWRGTISVGDRDEYVSCHVWWIHWKVRILAHIYKCPENGATINDRFTSLPNPLCPLPSVGVARPRAGHWGPEPPIAGGGAGPGGGREEGGRGGEQETPHPEESGQHEGAV